MLSIILGIKIFYNPDLAVVYLRNRSMLFVYWEYFFKMWKGEGVICKTGEVDCTKLPSCLHWLQTLVRQTTFMFILNFYIL